MTMTKTIALAILLAATTAHADEWTGPDKTKHLLAGAAIAGAVTIATQSTRYGFWAGTAAGFAKEAYDATGRGHVSAKDLIVTAVCAYAGAQFGGLVITPRGVSYSMQINIF